MVNKKIPDERLLIHEKFSKNKKRLVTVFQIGHKTYDDIDIIEQDVNKAMELFAIRSIELGVPAIPKPQVKKLTRKESNV